MARILLCDDEAHILRAAEIKLRRAGYEVFMASDGQEGWQAVLDHAPDLVFTDCQMPYVNGLELAERIKNNPETCHIPVYMLTAKGFELSEDVAIEQYGIRKIIAKPFSPRALVTEAEAVLSQDSATESPATADEGTA